MSEACVGHIQPSRESFARLLARYDDNPVGFVAELAKVNGERKLMHEILNNAGIPSKTSQGKGLCLIARLSILAERIK